jgi:hypothetical protein
MPEGVEHIAGWSWRGTPKLSPDTRPAGSDRDLSGFVRSGPRLGTWMGSPPFPAPPQLLTCSVHATVMTDVHSIFSRITAKPAMLELFLFSPLESRWMERGALGHLVPIMTTKAESPSTSHTPQFAPSSAHLPPRLSTRPCNLQVHISAWSRPQGGFVDGAYACA